MITHVHILHGCRNLGLSWWMSHVVATGLTTGTGLALFWKLLEGAALGPTVPFFCPVRPALEIHWLSLVLGVLIGLLAGPVIEALVGLRFLVYQAVVNRLVGQPASPARQRQLYRLL
jgi:ethanolamine transporter EutH